MQPPTIPEVGHKIQLFGGANERTFNKRSMKAMRPARPEGTVHVFFTRAVFGVLRRSSIDREKIYKSGNEQST
ncbi:MAG: hypothetical protein D3914_00750 [Candidatus Electrothrix sp. LOE2]|nr:hypothetical protein [Candidatus Electrothrix sp. LOE2]